MRRSGKHPTNSPDSSRHDVHGVASRYHQTDSPSRDEQIRRRAYELYLERGEQPGHAGEDWLQAERECQEAS